MQRKLKVSLNGTRENPFRRWGMKQNPFPQTGKHEESAACLRLQSLGGEPIPENHEQYIRARLEGFDEELIKLCLKNFRRGEYVEFEVHWEEQT